MKKEKMLAIQKGHIASIKTLFATGTNKRMIAFNAAIRVASAYSRMK